MNWRDWTDWIWPTLAPLPDNYHDNLKNRWESKIRAKTQILANNPVSAKIWAKEELRKLRNEQERNYRQSQKVEFYRNVSLTSFSIPLITILVALVPEISNGSLWTASPVERVFFVILFIAVIYIVLNAQIAFRSAYRALNPKTYLGNPLSVDVTGVKDDLKIAAERSRTQLKWTIITDRIISERKLARQAMKNVVRGTLIVLSCIVISGFTGDAMSPPEDHTGNTELTDQSTTSNDSSYGILPNTHTSVVPKPIDFPVLYAPAQTIEIGTSTSVMIDTLKVPTVEANNQQNEPVTDGQ